MQNPKYSIIVPVFNRPDEVDELLQSLTQQTYSNFEVVIVEDGSSAKCDAIVKNFNGKLNISYHFKENTGPGTTRNYGANKARGEYFIFFDSDCIIPSTYMEIVDNELLRNPVDAFGGPDRAHSSFTPIQKAINFSMTSFFTTGGIRGGKERMDKFYPRSFNMGISRGAFLSTGGFASMRFGEDVDFSLRLVREGFSTRLFQSAFVYHKRRTDFKKFYRQVYNSGIARINLHLMHRGSLKLVHLLPSAFVIFMIAIVAFCVLQPMLLVAPAFYSMAVFINSLFVNRSFGVAWLSIGAAWVQLFGYGLGFIKAFWRRVVLSHREFRAFDKNFYS